MRSKLILIIAIAIFALDANARNKEIPGISPNGNAAGNLQKRAENCFPPTAFITENLNNVNYGLEVGGLLWYDQVDPQYEVPKDGGVHSLFAGGLWMGGRTPDGNLKLAAVTYRQNGTDYWAGPLSIDGTANALTVLCQEFDRHFTARLVDVQLHNLYYERIRQIAEEGADPDILTDPPFENGYAMPDYFNEWPGNNFTPNYSFLLAPFGDRNQDGIYDPNDGDFPGYDLTGDIDCRSRGPQDPIPLFGDETIWWVFNDNAGIHTESTDGEPIGMEIQAQSFVYSTTDEINNMTFYNYVLINRGVQTLTDTYFGQYADADIGCSEDDYVGCDVQRGLGYMYNGDDFDAACNGSPGYGDAAPAIGIDFFEGPYLDPDGLNNPISSDPSEWENIDAIPYPGIGLGYYNPDLEEPDEIIDNERLGMQKFVYYDRLRSFPQTDPDNAVQFYNYLQGLWQNGQPFTYGGLGIDGDVICNYVVPNDTDPLGYGTGGLVQDDWSEETDGNPVGDRRFLQSAGPFTLDPGEFNNITVGVVWTQADGGVDELRDALFIADDKAQALFDNCFRILNGPGAPGVEAQELDQEIILYLSDTEDTENYIEEDPAIPDGEDKNYVFEGYKIFQLANTSVSSTDLDDTDKARLVRQVDIQNGVGPIINYITVPGIDLPLPTEMVDGEDQGIQHSFSFTNDAFTGGQLINHKPYYYMVIAYGYNEYAPYNQDGTGQDTPYLEGRLSASGTSIQIVTAIPHKTEMESNGAVITAEYGEQLAVTRIEGKGSGGNFLRLTDESVSDIMSGAPWVADELTYEGDGAPITVKVVDPLNVQPGNFSVRFYGEDPDEEAEIDNEDTRWEILNQQGDVIGSSTSTIDVKEEFLMLDYGISVQVEQQSFVENGSNDYPDFLGATLTFEDPEIDWLTGVEDQDGNTEQNWIRSGSNFVACEGGSQDDAEPFGDPCYYNDNGSGGVDPNSTFESVLGGIVAPWIVAGSNWSGPAATTADLAPNVVRFEELNNVNIVFTDDKDLWSRVPVFEQAEFSEAALNGSSKLYPRNALSVDKNGLNELQGGNMDEITYNGDQVITQSFIDEYMEDGSGNAGFSDDVIEAYKRALFPDDPDADDRPDSDLFGHSFGYGWFPGYAIDVETGERLNMAFGENSYLGAQNGADMIWNPTSEVWNPFIDNPEFNPINAKFGGMHYVYVFRNESRVNNNSQEEKVAYYDGSNRLFKKIYGKPTNDRRQILRSISWVMLPLLKDNFELKSVENGLIPSEATIRLRVNKPYERFPTIAKWLDDPMYLAEDGIFDFDDDNVEIYEDDMETLSENDWFPWYTFSTNEVVTDLNNLETAQDALGMINVVPNPYYGFSFYENSRLDNRVKIINLPVECTIRIFNTAGTLVRTIGKDNDNTFVEWDLKNENNIQIAGGTYIIHVEAPGIGEKVVKWFGSMKKVDLENF